MLGRCNARAFWRNRYYEDLWVYDCAGGAFRVRSARPVQPVGAVRRVVARLLNRRLNVQIELEDLRPCSLAGLKAELEARGPDLPAPGE